MSIGMEEAMDQVAMAAEGNDDGLDLEMQPGVLSTPIGQLSQAIAVKLAETEPRATSGFLPIIIGLLPVLADLLMQNCNPTPERLAQSMQSTNSRPLRRRRFVNRINEWTRDSKGMDVYTELGRQKFGVACVDVFSDPENEQLVINGMTSPAPVRPPIMIAFGN